MTTKTVLLPCPFCLDGGKPALHSYRIWDHQLVCIECESCDASLHLQETKEKAIAAWNTRLVPPARAVPDDAAVEERLNGRDKLWIIAERDLLHLLSVKIGAAYTSVADASARTQIPVSEQPTRAAGDERIQQAVKELEDILALRLSPDSTLQQGVYAHGGSNVITAFTRLRESVELVHILLAAAPTGVEQE